MLCALSARMCICVRVPVCVCVHVLVCARCIYFQCFIRQMRQIQTIVTFTLETHLVLAAMVGQTNEQTNKTNDRLNERASERNGRSLIWSVSMISRHTCIATNNVSFACFVLPLNSLLYSLARSLGVECVCAFFCSILLSFIMCTLKIEMKISLYEHIPMKRVKKLNLRCAAHNKKLNIMYICYQRQSLLRLSSQKSSNTWRCSANESNNNRK